MIDAFCKWQTEADAKADAVMLANQFGISFNNWRTDHVLPNVKVWRPSQDTGTPPNMVHNYLAGWFAIVSIRNQVPELMSLAATQFVLDRDGPPYVIQQQYRSRHQ